MATDYIVFPYHTSGLTLWAGLSDIATSEYWKESATAGWQGTAPTFADRKIALIEDGFGNYYCSFDFASRSSISMSAILYDNSGNVLGGQNFSVSGGVIVSSGHPQITTAITAIDTKLGTPATTSVSADIVQVKTDTGNLATRIPATLFSGITYMKNWLACAMGKTADTTTRTEINATTAGAGYNETTDSQEALRDRGDAAWTTATSVTVSDKTGFKLASDGLDSVSTTAPSGVAANFREMLVQVWRRFFKKTVYDDTANTLKTYADDGTTELTTQTATSTGGVDTQDAAT